jgi:diaminopimelate decarboxylase
MIPPEQRFGSSGTFSVDGVTLEALLEAGQTPFYIYSGKTIRTQYRRLAAAFPGFGVCYSLKANPSPAVCRLLREEGAGAEVSSELELRTALDAGFPPNDIVFVGPAKKAGAVQLAVESGIHAIVADSAEELREIDGAAGKAGRTQPVMLRINTREQPQSREVMVGGPSKFGFDEEKLVEQVGIVELRHARIVGIQVYSASGVLDVHFLRSHFEYVLKLAFEVSKAFGFKLECIDFGGGFGVPYSEGEPDLDIEAVGSAARELVDSHSDTLGGCRMMLESGRYIVAESGVFVTRVARVKDSRGRTFVITDSGMNGFSRPVFMNVAHPVRLLNRLDEPPAGRVEVCGPVCTPIDCIGRDVPLPRPEPGDCIGVYSAGAYGYSMSLQRFMSLDRPAELLVDKGAVEIQED